MIEENHDTGVESLAMFVLKDHVIIRKVLVDKRWNIFD